MQVVRKAIFLTLVAVFGGGCSAGLPVAEPRPMPPIRFLLTFDDGPDIAVSDNPTVKVADTLATNPVLPGIKAVFFVQTRVPSAGGSPLGQRLLRRLAAEGHLLALHSGTVRGHINHPTMDAAELAASLRDGIADIHAVSGEAPDLVRPPNWEFTAATLAAYRHAGIGMVLTDLRARDGAGWFFQDSPVTGGRLYEDLQYFRDRFAAGNIPIVDGVVPVVVTFHDTNRYTANFLAVYLKTLIDLAREQNFVLAEPPYYTDRAALLRAARARADNNATRAAMSPQ